MSTANSIFNLFKIIVLPYFKEHKLKVLLSVLGVALGVAVFISIRSASVSADQAMINFVKSISADSDLEVSYARTGLDENIYPKIVQTEGVELASPIISTRTRIKVDNKYHSIHVLGIDIIRRGQAPGQIRNNQFNFMNFISEPGQVIVTEAFLNKYKLTKKDSFVLVTGKKELKCSIASVIKSSESPMSKDPRLILMDIFLAQDLFNKENKIDRVDVTISKGFTIDDVKTNLRQNLGKQIRIRTAGEKVKQSGVLYRSFKLNLTVVSSISLLVGMYLIFNTINTSIIQQRREIGILRALGTRKSEILILFTVEGFVIGIIGSIVGIILGYFLAQVSVAIFTQKISRSYLLSNVSDIDFSPELIIIALFIGIAMSVISSIIPALSTLKISPAETIRSVSYENRKRLSILPYSIISIVFLILALISSQLKPVMGIPVFGFLANFLIILGFSFLSPLIIKTLLQLARPLLYKYMKIEMSLGAENLTKALARNAITISTLMISISLIISIFSLINSYHYSIGKWFKQVNNAEFSIVSGSNYSDGEIYPMKEEVAELLKDIKAIKEIDYYRFYNSSYNDYLLDIHSFRVDVASKVVQYSFASGNQKEAFQLMKTNEAVLISQQLSEKFNLNKGDKITLETPGGKKNFIIAGVVVNYLSTQGVVSISRELFKKYWNDNLVDIYKIYTHKNIDMIEVKKEIENKVKGNNNLLVSTLGDFKGEVLGAIDETFYMFHALEAITIIIAVMGVVNALLTSILERSREIGILRSIGAMKKQITVMILSEAAFIGFSGALIGILTGIALSYVTVYIINVQTVGWYLELKLPLDIIFYLIVISIVLTILAGYYPSKKAENINIREALEYE